MVPKPVQKPHPPLWMACSQLPTIERAGENGFGALGFQFVSADAAHAWVHAYYNAITKRLKKLADYEINPNMALVSFFMCAKTDEEARARADGATFFQFALRFYGASQNRQRPAPGTVNMWDEYNKWKRENPEAQEAALRGGLIGSPETIRKKLRRFRASHIDQVILLNQAGKNTHEHICESLELFGQGSDAGVPDTIPSMTAWKKGVMSGAIKLEEIDTEAFKDRYGKLAVNVAPAPRWRRDSVSAENEPGVARWEGSAAPVARVASIQRTDLDRSCSVKAAWSSIQRRPYLGGAGVDFHRKQSLVEEGVGDALLLAQAGRRHARRPYRSGGCWLLPQWPHQCPTGPPSNVAASFGCAFTHLPVSSSLPKIAFKTSPRRSANAADDR